MLEALELDKIPFLPDPPHESIFRSSQLEEGVRRLKFVETCVAAEEKLVVIVDEGQLLSEDGLQQLRLLTNRDFDTRPPFALILAGCPELREALAHTALIAAVAGGKTTVGLDQLRQAVRELEARA